jgi:hypothetical protein
VAGEESTVPPGFTLGRDLAKDGTGKNGWRCGELKQDTSTGEWRRCSKDVEKRDCLAHKKSGKHKYTIACADDPGFPTDFDEQREKIVLQRGFKQIQEAIALFYARTNMSEKQGGKP